MKNLLLFVLALLTVCALTKCTKSKSQEEITKEVLVEIDSILNSSAPTITDIKELGVIKDITVEARDANHNGAHCKFILLAMESKERYGISRGVAIIPLSETSDVCHNLDSIASVIKNSYIDTQREISFASNGGIKIVSKSEKFGESKSYWWVTSISFDRQGSCSTLISYNELLSLIEKIREGKAWLEDK